MASKDGRIFARVEARTEAAIRRLADRDRITFSQAVERVLITGLKNRRLYADDDATARVAGEETRAGDRGE